MPRTVTPAGPKRAPFRLWLEELEQRQTPSISVVPQAFTATQYTALNITQEQLLAGATGSPSFTLSGDPTQPAHATLANNHSGTFTFTPDPDFTGTTSFQYTVRSAGHTVFTDPNGKWGDMYGNVVALDGDTALVAAPVQNGSKNGGFVDVFVRSGNTWTHQATLTPSEEGGFSTGSYALSVAISGDTAVIGDLMQMNDAGAAYVFVRSGNTWSQQAKLTLPDAAAYDIFGKSVAIDGDTAVIGAEYRAVPTSQGLVHSGAAYVYVRSGTTWTQQATLTASDSAEMLGFGMYTALSGDTAVVTTKKWDSSNTPGKAYVFERSGTTWSQQAEFTVVQSIQDSNGTPVSISGDTILVGGNVPGASGQPPRGAAYVFVRSGSTWTQQVLLTESDPLDYASFGASVSVRGDMAVIGAPIRGNAYVFVRHGTTWDLDRTLPDDPADKRDYYGTSVALSDDTALVGTPFQTVAGQFFQGAAIVYNVGSATATATVQVQPATAALAVAPASLPAGSLGSVYPSLTFTATGGAGNQYTFQQSGVLPAGLVFDPGTARLVGTPVQVGQFPGIIIAASDGQGGSGSQTYTLTINGQLQADLDLAAVPVSSQGLSVTYRLSVTNLGRDFASNVILEIWLTFAVLSQPLPGTWSQGPSFFTSNLGTLAPGARSEVELSVAPFAGNDHLGFHAQVRSDAYDSGGASGAADVRWPTVGPDDGYVAGLYQDLLGRAPDPSGLAYWTSLLAAGATRGQVVAGIYGSPEHCGVMVDQDYAAYLHRPADAPGRAYWVAMLLAGVSEADVAEGFLTSAEYRAGRYTVEAYVSAFYADVLGRAPAPEELAYWKVLAKFGLTPDLLARSLLASAEGYRRQVEQDYQETLGRPADEPGAAYWTAMMQTGGMSPSDVTLAFLNSPEYLGRLNPAPQ